MLQDEIAERLHLSLSHDVTGPRRRVRSITLQEFLTALIEHNTAKAAAPVLGISRQTLSEIGKELFPEKVSKEYWSTFLYSVLDKKKCSKCNEIKSLDEFRNTTNKGRPIKHTMCEPCLVTYGKDRYNADKPKHQEWNKNWITNNPGWIAQRSAKRRAAILNQTPENADLALITKIYEHCPSGWHVDHIIPISKGGLHHQDNLCYLWASDNLKKADKMPEEVPDIMAKAIYPLGEEGLF